MRIPAEAGGKVLGAYRYLTQPLSAVSGERCFVVYAIFVDITSDSGISNSEAVMHADTGRADPCLSRQTEMYR